jgi:hypothetical protein
MNANVVEFQTGTVWPDTNLEFDDKLSTTGIEIDIDELEVKQGLLSIRGRQVLLFIPDHGFKVMDTLVDPSLGNKFHVTDCKTLELMKRKNRFARYKITNSFSGIFEIFGTNENGDLVEDEARLHVCKNCLNQLNYKGAANQAVKARNEIVKTFKIDEFFQFSVLFLIDCQMNILKIFRKDIVIIGLRYQLVFANR